MPVKGRGALGGQSGGLGFEQQAKFHVVEVGFLVPREQLDQRLGNGRADDIGDEGTPTLPGLNQSLFLESLQRLAQGLAGNVEPVGEVALAGQALAIAQGTVEDHLLDLLDHGLGHARVLNLPELVLAHSRAPNSQLLYRGSGAGLTSLRA